MSDRRGVALVMTLAAAVLVGSLTLVALHAAVIRTRLVGDGRRAVEGIVVASTALAAVRVGHQRDLDTLSDGATFDLPPALRPDGWSWSAHAVRVGVMLRLNVAVRFRASDGSTHASHAASLLLTRNPADTVRVLARWARF
jgi:hypothetical protein